MQDAKKKELLSIIYRKCCDARADDKMWDESNYEWEIGYNAVMIIKDGDKRLFYFDERETCYGINVRINFENPNKIELWKKVK